MRWAVFYCTPSTRISRWPLIASLSLRIRWMACNHLLSGTWLLSNTVPTVTVNWRLHPPQRRRPIRPPLTGVIRSVPPQRGQTGPLGQTVRSSSANAAASSWK